jgi:hypothetical protein
MVQLPDRLNPLEFKPKAEFDLAGATFTGATVLWTAVVCPRTQKTGRVNFQGDGERFSFFVRATSHQAPT